MSEILRITCASLVCSVGNMPGSAAAAMRAGITGLAELPILDGQGEPIVGAAVHGLDQGLRGRERLIELLAAALDGIEVCVPLGIELEHIPILLCTREPERPGPSVRGILAEVEARLGLTLRRDRSAHIAHGSVGSFEALMHARSLVVEGQADVCLICAIDTLLDPQTLLWLDRAGRLKTPAQPDGVIPGEAACVVLATARSLSQAQPVIRGLGFAAEAATVLNDEPLLGKGMASAAASALDEAGMAMHEIEFRLSDAAGDPYSLEEMSLAQSRLMRQRREAQDIWLPAGCVGDCGAASGLIQIAWAEQAFARGYAPGLTALLHTGTAAGARAAAVIRAGG